MAYQYAHPYRTSPDTLDHIRADLDGLLANSVELMSITPPASLNAARALWMRQALEAAADHAAALLPLLDAPILVEADVMTFDRSAALDALDAAVVALDDLDADPDLEPSLGYYAPGYAYDVEDEPEHDEHSLGWREAVSQLDLGMPSPDGEPTLGAPERHPYFACIGSPYYEPGDGSCRRIRNWHSQASWAQGERRDGEGEAEPGYDLPEGDSELDDDGLSDGEKDDSELEHELGAPAGDGDQEHWAQGFDGETVNEDGDGATGPDANAPHDYARPISPRRLDPMGHRLDDERQAIARRAREAAARRRPVAHRDHDTVTPIGPGMVSWGGPMRHPLSLCNVSAVAMPVRVVGP